MMSKSSIIKKYLHSEVAMAETSSHEKRPFNITAFGHGYLVVEGSNNGTIWSDKAQMYLQLQWPWVQFQTILVNKCPIS